MNIFCKNEENHIESKAFTERLKSKKKTPLNDKTPNEIIERFLLDN